MNLEVRKIAYIKELYCHHSSNSHKAIKLETQHEKVLSFFGLSHNKINGNLFHDLRGFPPSSFLFSSCLGIDSTITYMPTFLASL